MRFAANVSTYKRFDTIKSLVERLPEILLNFPRTVRRAVIVIMRTCICSRALNDKGRVPHCTVQLFLKNAKCSRLAASFKIEWIVKKRERTFGNKIEKFITFQLYYIRKNVFYQIIGKKLRDFAQSKRVNFQSI